MLQSICRTLSDAWPFSSLLSSSDKRSEEEQQLFLGLEGQELLDAVIEITLDASVWSWRSMREEWDIHRETAQQDAWDEATVDLTMPSGELFSVELTKGTDGEVDSVSMQRFKERWDKVTVHEGSKVELIPRIPKSAEDPSLNLMLKQLRKIAARTLRCCPQQRQAAIDFFTGISPLAAYEWIPKDRSTSPIPAKPEDSTGLWIKGFIANGLNALSVHLKRIELLTERGTLRDLRTRR